jgi:seryl-tRNA synthetase
LQVFRQRENVRAGPESAVEEWRATWLDRGMSLLQGLGLPVSIDVAHDPFFGRGGRMLKSNQRNTRGKFEISMALESEAGLTALASFNYHGSKFGSAFDILTTEGDPAHTACVGFGLERVALALLAVHGFDLAVWPRSVRTKLGW